MPTDLRRTLPPEGEGRVGVTSPAATVAGCCERERRPDMSEVPAVRPPPQPSPNGGRGAREEPSPSEGEGRVGADESSSDRRSVLARQASLVRRSPSRLQPRWSLR